MNPLEMAMRRLTAETWTAANVLGGSEDWTIASTREHIKSCPLRQQYDDLWRASVGARYELDKAGKHLKDQLFSEVLSGAGTMQTRPEEGAVSPLEENLAEMFRKSWYSFCVLGHDSDYITSKTIEHMKTCPIHKDYSDLSKTCSEFKKEWNATRKIAKEMLFQASIELKKLKDEEEKKRLALKEKNE